MLWHYPQEHGMGPSQGCFSDAASLLWELLCQRHSEGFCTRKKHFMCAISRGNATGRSPCREAISLPFRTWWWSWRRIRTCMTIHSRANPAIAIACVYAGFAPGGLLIRDQFPPEGYNCSTRPWFTSARNSQPGISMGNLDKIMELSDTGMFRHACRGSDKPGVPSSGSRFRVDGHDSRAGRGGL